MKFIEKQINTAIEKIELLNALDKTRHDLEQLGDIPSGNALYDYAIKFFNITTSLYDNYYININLLRSTREDARSFADSILFTGHRYNGWVRAPRGESVTLKNLYIRYGVKNEFSQPVEFFKNSPDSQIQLIAQNKLYSFINQHRKPMIESLYRIVKFNKKPNNCIIRHIYKKRNEITK